MILSYAVVRTDPPEVYLADDVDTLQWVLALQVVAAHRARCVWGTRRRRSCARRCWPRSGADAVVRVDRRHRHPGRRVPRRSRCTRPATWPWVRPSCSSPRCSQTRTDRTDRGHRQDPPDRAGHGRGPGLRAVPGRSARARPHRGARPRSFDLAAGAPAGHRGRAPPSATCCCGRSTTAAPFAPRCWAGVGPARSTGWAAAAPPGPPTSPATSPSTACGSSRPSTTRPACSTRHRRRWWTSCWPTTPPTPTTPGTRRWPWPQLQRYYRVRAPGPRRRRTTPRRRPRPRPRRQGPPQGGHAGGPQLAGRGRGLRRAVPGRLHRDHAALAPPPGGIHRVPGHPDAVPHAAHRRRALLAAGHEGRLARCDWP